MHALAHSSFLNDWSLAVVLNVASGSLHTTERARSSAMRALLARFGSDFSLHQALTKRRRYSDGVGVNPRSLERREAQLVRSEQPNF
jgi:hypothetical protein